MVSLFWQSVSCVSSLPKSITQVMLTASSGWMSMLHWKVTGSFTSAGVPAGKSLVKLVMTGAGGLFTTTVVLSGTVLLCWSLTVRVASYSSGPEYAYANVPLVQSVRSTGVLLSPVLRVQVSASPCGLFTSHVKVTASRCVTGLVASNVVMIGARALFTCGSCVPVISLPLSSLTVSVIVIGPAVS